MTSKITKFFPETVILLAFVLLFSGCKKHDEVPQQDQLTLLKQKVSGEWEFTKGVYMEYDETGKVSYTENLPFESPKPWYDFRNPEILYLSDRYGRQAIGYKISISDNNISRIEIGEKSYDIAHTFNITNITDTNMTWVLEQRFDNAGPGFVSRVYTEYNFTKQ
ncbi:hypothetical protein IM793_06545 [Pedobacter sp. MR2016-19]|uniref:hypothetical protein n=1 Tax=Pedobacter sp. MR2016-19 TaxID=2780089 RepID=UPI001873DC0A|nr:hypothetical protein [Pedobacter sp. MR2016-19]MBE5318804.1 hypothetical protein [Pedobacter sp. MR2016-19]